MTLTASSEKNKDFTSFLLEESSTIAASDAFKKKANIQSYSLYEEAELDRLGFWEEQAQSLDWFQKWDQVLEWNPPYAKWFIGGKLNASYNCLDRHMNTEVRYKTALLWEGERGDTRSLSYEELYKEVCQFSAALKSLGIQKGDTVAIYMPMIPEAIIAMLSCARVGAIHTVVFGGFSSEALRDRILDANAKLIITADGGFRKGKIIPLKESSSLAAEQCPSVEHIIVVQHTHDKVSMQESRDIWYHDLMKTIDPVCPAEPMDAEDVLFILYTSGTTGKPKGIVHTTGGYMVGATQTTKWVFDVKPADVFWCTADIGWITGHSYVVYGPLSNGMTQLIYEGAPDFPEKDRFWSLIEKYKVTTFYTAPTAIRTFMKWGDAWIQKHDLSSLRLLGSVGEPINPEAWMWYYSTIGQKRCPIVDTWWQTETGSIMVSSIPGLVDAKPGSASKALPGIEVGIFNDDGKRSSSGYFAITSPWPSMLRGVHNDPKRYEETYWNKWDGMYYFTADGARQDNEGYYWLMGRVDDVINVSGHRLGTMEVESALVDYPSVAEAAVIAISHAIKGQAIACFVTLKEKTQIDDHLEQTLKEHVAKKIGPLARPEKILFLADLPKTRSGKIMRRLLRDIAEGRVVGDMTTLSDPSVIADIKNRYVED